MAGPATYNPRMRPTFGGWIGVRYNLPPDSFDPLSGSPSFWGAARLLTGLNDGDLVSTLTDQSGNGRNFTQGTDANKPTFKNGGQGGQPYLNFTTSGGADYLVAGVNSSNFITNSAYTMIGVVKITAAPSTGFPLYGGGAIIADGTGDAKFAMVGESDNKVAAYNDPPSGSGAETGATIGTTYTFTQQHSGGVLSIQANDAAAGTVAAGNTASLAFTPHFNGNYDLTVFLSMQWYEFFIFPTALSAGAIANYKTFLKGLYGHYA